ncbi:MAG: PHP domain-containing protein, partial [bacterium]|nr:PHP domain-containing protein [bacterium]
MTVHKALFHTHSSDDPHDRFISYSTEELIDEAAKKGVTIMSLTCHQQVIFDQDYRRYAAERNILLLPGIEQKVEGRDVNILNAAFEADQVKTFADLKTYRAEHPDSFIFAPHPYFPGPRCLHGKLDEHLNLFDGIELSHFYHRLVDFNKKAAQLSTLNSKPFLATPDCHFLENVDIAHCLLQLPYSIQELLGHPNPAAVVFAAL